MSTSIQRRDATSLRHLENRARIQLALQQMLRWRDALWDALLEDLAQRDPLAGIKVREALATRPALINPGRSTRYAMWAWQALDARAREEWIWVCQYIHATWIRGELGKKIELEPGPL